MFEPRLLSSILELVIRFVNEFLQVILQELDVEFGALISVQEFVVVRQPLEGGLPECSG